MNDAIDSDLDSELPGTPMARRPVHFFWLLDCSSSMGVNGKIGQLNFAIREALPEMRSAAAGNPAAELMIRAVTFGSRAAWVGTASVLADHFVWKDVKADGSTEMGAAFKLVAQELRTPPMPERAMPPVLVLVSDGQPTDDWHSGLRAIDATPWGKRAVRVAVAIGDDADLPMMQQFLVNPELKVLRAHDGQQIVDQIRWASTSAVRSASTGTPAGHGMPPDWRGPQLPRQPLAPLQSPPADQLTRPIAPQGFADAGDGDVW